MQKKQRIPKNIKEQRTKKAKGASAWNPRIQTAVEGQIAVFF